MMHHISGKHPVMIDSIDVDPASDCRDKQSWDIKSAATTVFLARNPKAIANFFAKHHNTDNVLVVSQPHSPLLQFMNNHSMSYPIYGGVEIYVTGGDTIERVSMYSTEHHVVKNHCQGSIDRSMTSTEAGRHRLNDMEEVTEDLKKTNPRARIEITVKCNRSAFPDLSYDSNSFKMILGQGENGLAVFRLFGFL